jgi:hypothetical protein
MEGSGCCHPEREEEAGGGARSVELGPVENGKKRNRRDQFLRRKRRRQGREERRKVEGPARRNRGASKGEPGRRLWEGAVSVGQGGGEEREVEPVDR